MTLEGYFRILKYSFVFIEHLMKQLNHIQDRNRMVNFLSVLLLRFSVRVYFWRKENDSMHAILTLSGGDCLILYHDNALDEIFLHISIYVFNFFF